MTLQLFKKYDKILKVLGGIVENDKEIFEVLHKPLEIIFIRYSKCIINVKFGFDVSCYSSAAFR